MLVARIHECFPLQCRRCGQAMRIVAFILAPQVIARILSHLGEEVNPPALSPARGPLSLPVET